MRAITDRHCGSPTRPCKPVSAQNLDLALEQADQHQDAVAAARVEQLAAQEHRFRVVPHFGVAPQPVRNSRAYGGTNTASSALAAPMPSIVTTCSSAACALAQSGRSPSAMHDGERRKHGCQAQTPATGSSA